MKDLDENLTPQEKQEKETLRKDVRKFQNWAMLLGGLSLVIGALICGLLLLFGKVPIR